MSYFLQENKAREIVDVKRRQRERLQSAAKRRSTATCSSRDKEMDGIALESILQSFLTKPTSRRRPGRPLSTHGSPTSSSPKNGSLSEITSQTNLPIENQKHVGSFGVKVLGIKEWNSAAELTVNSSQKNLQSNTDDKIARIVIAAEKEMKISTKVESRGFTHPAKRLTSIPSTCRSLSATTDDGEEDLQDNNEEEAQKLREASKKVLRFQNSRGSVSSGEFSLENQKSPTAAKTLPRQLTFEEETERYPGDPTNEELVRLLFNSQSSAKRNLGRRHTLPTKVAKTEEEDNNQWTQQPIKSPKSVMQEKAPVEGESFTDISYKLRNTGSQDQNLLPAEKKSKPVLSSAHVPDEKVLENNQEGTSVGATRPQINNENIPTRSMWFKTTENSGLFFSFFKRLGDISKLQNSKEPQHKGTDTTV